MRTTTLTLCWLIGSLILAQENASGDPGVGDEHQSVLKKLLDANSSVPGLIEALRDENASARRAAVRALHRAPYGTRKGVRSRFR